MFSIRCFFHGWRLFKIICSSCGMFSFVNCSCWFREACVVGTVVVVCSNIELSVSLGMPDVWSPFVIEIGIASLGESVQCVACGFGMCCGVMCVHKSRHCSLS